MKDFVLEISYDPADTTLSEIVHGLLFLAKSIGNSATEGGGRVTVSAYFDSAEQRDDAARQLERLHVDLNRTERERIDWLDRYQQSLRAISVGKRFVVAPDEKLFKTAGAPLRLIIPQEQAFGTGTHESTALSIELLEALDLRGARALDIGAGSGILSLAMLALGARKVIAFDNDLDAFRPLRENRMRNRVAAERMPLFIGELESLRETRFDAIAMNILPDVIIPMLPQVASRLSGALILSGILTVNRDDVISEGRRWGLRLERQLEKGEWWAGSFRLDAA